MGEVNVIVDDLENKIITKGKENINYMGKACEDLLKNFEEQNEKIRAERQIRYSKNIDDIHVLCDGIKEILVSIQSDMKRNGERLAAHEEKINQAKEDIKELKGRAK